MIVQSSLDDNKLGLEEDSKMCEVLLIDLDEARVEVSKTAAMVGIKVL